MEDALIARLHACRFDLTYLLEIHASSPSKEALIESPRRTSSRGVRLSSTQTSSSGWEAGKHKANVSRKGLMRLESLEGHWKRSVVLNN